jgi:virginiamycin B lyase
MHTAAAALGLLVTLASHEAVSSDPVITDVRFRVWATPGDSPFPYAIALAADGGVWYSASKANRLGRLDPKGGGIRQYALPTANSGPSGVAIDRNGDVWYAGSSAGLVGKLAPKTGSATEFRMPDPKATDPHGLAFDSRGLLWFTVEVGNFVGMLNPKTGNIILVSLPAAGSLPRDIKIDSRGTPFFAEFGANRIGNISPTTMKIAEYVLPDPDARPIGLSLAKDDSIYYTDHYGGFLGHLTPGRNSFDEHLSQGGSRSRPYAITTDSDGSVWYCETGEQGKSALVRFEPKARTMRVWTVPINGGTISHIVAARNGDLWLAASDAGQIVRARPMRLVREGN